jgi:hypothetical protein
VITCTECRRDVPSEKLQVVTNARLTSYQLRTRCCDALLMVGPISDLDPLFARESRPLPGEAVLSDRGTEA